MGVTLRTPGAADGSIGWSKGEPARAAPVMRFAEIAVDAPAGHDRTFSYSVPPPLEVTPGQLVLVPFGPRTLQGVVFCLEPAPRVEKTRDIARVQAPEPVLTEHQLALARWISSYYMCTLFEAAALMLPPGGRLRLKTYLEPGPGSDTAQGPTPTPFQMKVLHFIQGRRRVSEDRLVATMGEAARGAVTRLTKNGLVLRSQARSSARVGRKFREYVRLARPMTPTLAGELAGMSPKAPRRVELVERLVEGAGPMLLAEARKRYGPSAVNGLLEKGWLQRQRLEAERDPLEGSVFPPRAAVALTPSQRRAASEVRAALDGESGPHRVFLVEGVTGSGKTEIYLDAVNRCLELGRRAIVLVPEIALTHQTVERFASRFPGNVAVLHSGLTPGQRFDQWWKVRRGEHGVVIGSRSAVFAPQPDLGLIVIDEEHEWTYKQHDSSPRYHTGDVALRLAKLNNSVVVLGSASPDLRSYHRAMSGGFRLLRLPHRIAPGRKDTTGSRLETALASTELVDMRTELRQGNRSIFSRALRRALGECLEDSSQAILFLNRRGSASYMQCRNCGFGLRCRRCDVGMTYHSADARLLCHYCGERRRPPTRCPQCMSHRMAFRGIGTQAVVDEVSSVFPGAKALRWDRDTARTPAAHRSLLERFRSGEAQVLVGTQMIAKGLHFPSVTLVGVVLADVGMNLPDYRAGERSFQLICQVAGRAGRGPSKGRVIVQTYQPENYAIKAAAGQDYPGFYHQELAHRRQQGNPPYAKLIRLLYAHTNVAMCEREAIRLCDLLRRERDSWGYHDTDVLGPTPGYPARLRGHYRWQLVLRGPNPRLLLDRASVPQGWVVDIDPVGIA